MGIEMPDINKIRKELDEKNAEMEKKERERIKEEYERLSGQKKPTGEKPEEKSEEKPEEKVKTEEEGEDKEEKKLDSWGLHDKWTKVCKNLEGVEDQYKVMGDCIDKSPEELHGYLNDNKSALSKEAKDWIETKIEVDKEEIAHFKKWGTNKDKSTTENEGVKKKDRETKRKGKRAKTEDIEWKKTEVNKKETDKIFKGTKERPKKRNKKEEKKEKDGKKEDLTKMSTWSEMKKIFDNPESISQFFTESSKKLAKISEILKDPNTLEKIKEVIGTEEFQALRKTIEKITKEKEEVPESVTKAAEFIKGEEKGEKKESPWGTAFGAINFSILFLLIIFMLLEIKGIDWLSGQATGKKKEKK